MKINTYTYPKSSFLSVEKDMDIIVNMILKNERLKKLLYYTTKDCLDKPHLGEEETLELIDKNIKIVPKIYIDGSVLNYLLINFDNFTPNGSNPEYRDNLIEFDIICHYDQWQLKDFQLRPYKIAAEIDTMFNNQHLTGIGKLHFIGASQINVDNDEYAGMSLLFLAIHGEEDKKNPLNPADEEQLVQNFNALFNED